MRDLDDVVNSFLFRRPRDPSPPHDAERLDDGVFHVDFHDPDHVYVVTVRQVPRIRLPLDGPVAVGEADGVSAQLVDVALANHIELTLDAEPSASREAALDDYRKRFTQWERRSEASAPSPPWPAESLTQIVAAVSDDVGTSYRRTSGKAGGPDTEWEVHWSFLPSPPPEARKLKLHFVSPGGSSTDVELPLPTQETRHRSSGA